MKHALFNAWRGCKKRRKDKTNNPECHQKGQNFSKKNDAGAWQIDLAELHRVYPPVSLNSLKEDKTLHGETPSNTNDNRVLQAEIEKLRELLAREKEINDDLKKDRDMWRQQATNLLTDQRQKPSQKPVESFLERLMGIGTRKD